MNSQLLAVLAKRVEEEACQSSAIRTMVENGEHRRARNTIRGLVGQMLGVMIYEVRYARCYEVAELANQLASEILNKIEGGTK